MNQNPFDLMADAVNHAEAVQRAADNQSRRMARIVAGRLQRADVDSSTLCALKKELANYNMHTGQWKD